VEEEVIHTKIRYLAKITCEAHRPEILWQKKFEMIPTIMRLPTQRIYNNPGPPVCADDNDIVAVTVEAVDYVLQPVDY
jgi:hypothetical protein